MAWSDKDLVSFLELNPELKQLLDQKVETTTFNENVQTVNNHIIDKTVHITEDERNTWNSSLKDSKDYTDTQIKDISGKISQSTSDMSKEVSDHIADKVAHITNEERTKWNSLGDAATSYVDKRINDINFDIKKYIDDSIKGLIADLQNGKISPSTVAGYRILISDSYPDNPVKDHEILLMPSASKIVHFDGLNWIDIYSTYK